MSGWLYEQDLMAQKYRILIATRHDRILRTVASDLGIGVQELRKTLIERLDMILLENLPARYEAAIAADQKVDDAVALALGRSMYSTGIPLVPESRMDEILRTTKERLDRGTSTPEAIAAGKTLIREAILQ
jgi:energy-converting hydrogenase A subunit M